jgi:hypothetical protein
MADEYAALVTGEAVLQLPDGSRWISVAALCWTDEQDAEEPRDNAWLQRLTGSLWGTSGAPGPRRPVAPSRDAHCGHARSEAGLLHGLSILGRSGRRGCRGRSRGDGASHRSVRALTAATYSRAVREPRRELQGHSRRPSTSRAVPSIPIGHSWSSSSAGQLIRRSISPLRFSTRSSSFGVRTPRPVGTIRTTGGRHAQRTRQDRAGERHHTLNATWSPRADRRDGEECAILTLDRPRLSHDGELHTGRCRLSCCPRSPPQDRLHDELMGKSPRGSDTVPRAARDHRVVRLGHSRSS